MDRLNGMACWPPAIPMRQPGNYSALKTRTTLPMKMVWLWIGLSFLPWISLACFMAWTWP